MGLTNENTPDSTGDSKGQPALYIMDTIQVGDTAPEGNHDTAVINIQDPSDAGGNSNKSGAPLTPTMGSEGDIRVSSSYSDLTIDLNGHTVVV